MAFDNDDVLDDSDDEDLKNDDISTLDLQVSFIFCRRSKSLNKSMQAHLKTFFTECAARNTNNFSAMVDQMTPDEIRVVRRLVEL